MSAKIDMITKEINKEMEELSLTPPKAWQFKLSDEWINYYYVLSYYYASVQVITFIENDCPQLYQLYWKNDMFLRSQLINKAFETFKGKNFQDIELLYLEFISSELDQILPAKEIPFSELIVKSLLASEIYIWYSLEKYLKQLSFNLKEKILYYLFILNTIKYYSKRVILVYFFNPSYFSTYAKNISSFIKSLLFSCPSFANITDFEAIPIMAVHYFHKSHESRILSGQKFECDYTNRFLLKYISSRLILINKELIKKKEALIARKIILKDKLKTLYQIAMFT